MRGQVQATNYEQLRPDAAATPAPDVSRRWLAPCVVLALIAVSMVALILVVHARELRDCERSCNLSTRLAGSHAKTPIFPKPSSTPMQLWIPSLHQYGK